MNIRPGLNYAAGSATGIKRTTFVALHVSVFLIMMLPAAITFKIVIRNCKPGRFYIPDNTGNFPPLCRFYQLKTVNSFFSNRIN